MTKEQESTEVRVLIQNKNPKKDPISYEIRTLQDISDVITNDNIDGFLKDFETALRYTLALRDIIKLAKEMGEIEELSKIHLPYFTWIDDWKPKRTRKKK